MDPWESSLIDLADRLSRQGARRSELAPRTKEEYLGDCRRVARWMADHGVARPEAMTASALDACFRDLEWTPATRRRARVALALWLQPHFPPSRSPADLVEAPKVVPGPVPRLTQEDAARVVEASPTDGATPVQAALGLRDRAILEVLYGSGLRRQEICDAMLAGLDFEHETLRVVGKGGKPRTVPLTENAVDALRRWLSDGRPRLVRRAPASTETEPVFVTRSGGPMDGSTVYRVVSKRLRAAGRAGGPHLLRHAAATHLLEGPDGEGGAHLRVVQEVLGHASLATTQRYTGVSTKAMQGVLRRGHPRG